MSSIAGIITGSQVRYTNPGEPNTLFSVSRTLSGDVLVIGQNVAAKPYRSIRVGFRFVAYSVVRQLENLGSNGIPFAFSLDDGPSGTAIVQPGSVSAEHEAWGKDAVHSALTGTAMDFYKGEVTIIQVS